MVHNVQARSQVVAWERKHEKVALREVMSRESIEESGWQIFRASFLKEERDSMRRLLSKIVY